MRTKHFAFRCFPMLALALATLLFTAPPLVCADEAITGSDQGEALANQVEGIFGQLAGSTHEAPLFTDLGGGFYSVSMTLSPELRERLAEAIRVTQEAKKAPPQTLFVISVGQAPALPASPVSATHGVLSDTTYPYTYWIITLNLGSQTVTKTTTFKLTGPGLKFNRSAGVVYGAGGIWGIGYRPGAGVGAPGIYTFEGSVSGGGAISTKSFAVNP
jgi:hypothetical protein